MKLNLFLICLLTSFPIFALYEDDISFINEYDLVKTDVRKKMESWDVNSAELDIDNFKFKGTTRDTTDWKSLDPYIWLDFNTWAKQRKIKDDNLEWRKKLRETEHSEVMGRVLKCLGLCSNFRGDVRTKAVHLSILKEGDEFVTENDSYAWIMLVDGSMVKVLPNSSITLHEINFSKSEIFVMMRLNRGYINYQTRIMGKFIPLNEAESDLSFYPLKLLQSNREFYSIKEYRKLNDDEKLEYSIEKNPGYKGQYEKLNKLMALNDEFFKNRNTRFFIYSPNISIEGSNASLDMFYEPNGKSYFQFNNTIRNFNKKDLRIDMKYVYFRGYKNTSSDFPDIGEWYEVDRQGKSMKPTNQFKHEFSATKAFLNRIPTIYLARELWIQKYSSNLLNTKIMPIDLAEKFGYRLWNVEDKTETLSRLEFIKEYTRRVETTNLFSLEKILRKEKIEGFNKTYFARAMLLHYSAIRNRFSEENLKIREMSNTHYYLWTIKNGRKEN